MTTLPANVKYRDLLRAAVRSKLAYLSPADMKKEFSAAKGVGPGGPVTGPSVTAALSAAVRVAESVRVSAPVSLAAAVRSDAALVRDVLGDVDAEPLFVTSPPDTNEDAQAYVWTAGGELYVTFRGTSSLADAWADADVAAVPMRGPDDKPVPGVLVHRGFYEQFMSVQPQISHVVLKHGADTSRVHFAGHSLGSGVAQLAAAYFGEKFSKSDRSVSCLTFGGPRAGNAAFARWFAKTCECVRVVNSNDPVPMVPQRWDWQHTAPTCVVIDDDGGVKLQACDVPWWRRLLFTVLNIDFTGPINDHGYDIYIARLERLAKQQDSGAPAPTTKLRL